MKAFPRTSPPSLQPIPAPDSRFTPARSQTGAGYLGWVVFADASARPHCKAGGSFAFTTPGSRVVYVCAAQLKDAVDRNLARAEAVVIHEMLHSLGLGENPPTSSEITARVQARCHS
jgi:hypothetical protein